LARPLEVFLAVVAICVILLTASSLGVFQQLQQYVAPPKPKPVEPFVGNVKLTWYCYNSFDGSQKAATIEYYRERAGAYSKIGAGNITIYMTPEDRGVLYAKISSSGAYVDDNKIVEASAGLIPTVTYIDIDNDGYLDHVFKLYLTKQRVPVPEGQTPEVVLLAYSMPRDTAIALNTPADLTGIGISPVDKYINWKLVFSSTNKAIKIVDVEVAVNSTAADTDIELKQLATFFGTFSEDKIEWQSANQRWLIDLGLPAKTEPNGILAAYKEGINPDFAYITAKFRCHFDGVGTDAYEVTLKVTYITETGTKGTISDTVLMSAA
jgi:hypothetical protein